MKTAFFKNRLTSQLLALSLMAFTVSCQNKTSNPSKETQTISKEVGKDLTLEDLRLKGMKFKNLKPHKQNEPKIYRTPSALATYNFGEENSHLKGIYIESFTSPKNTMDEASVRIYEYDTV